MSVNKKRIGISGGTFDPIHNGHLIISEEIRETHNLDKIIFVPTGKPPHKPGHMVTMPEHRFNMVKMAVSTNYCFDVSRIELDREGYIYTIDTMNFLKQQYEKETDFFFIAGSDVVWDLPKWKDPKGLFEICDFIVATRPGFDTVQLVKEADRLKREYNARITITKTPLIDISSSDIRERVQERRTIKYLVPECIEEYIKNNGLYI